MLRLQRLSSVNLGYPDGEVGAAMRYLSFSGIPIQNRKVVRVLTDIGVYRWRNCVWGLGIISLKKKSETNVIIVCFNTCLV